MNLSNLGEILVGAFGTGATSLAEIREKRYAREVENEAARENVITNAVLTDFLAKDRAAQAHKNKLAQILLSGGLAQQRAATPKLPVRKYSSDLIRYAELLGVSDPSVIVERNKDPIEAALYAKWQEKQAELRRQKADQFWGASSQSAPVPNAEDAGKYIDFWKDVERGFKPAPLDRGPQSLKTNRKLSGKTIVVRDRRNPKVILEIPEEDMNEFLFEEIDDQEQE